MAARPSYAALRGVYKTNDADIHKCTMQFPHTCAIRMSEALEKVVPGIMDKFRASGLNVCPHGYMRGPQDLASVLRRADVFGTYDYGFNNPGSAPADISGKQGLVCYQTIPGYSGQGHIDLWEGDHPAGSEYWNADTVWFWTLS